MKTDKPLNLPDSSAKQIVAHWTGGSYVPSSLDRNHYHFLVDGEAVVHPGEFLVSANDFLVTGEYAAHVRYWNTKTIGLAVCCMAGAKEKPFDPGRYPIKRIQWDTLAELAATLCVRYGIPITEKTVLMHSEVEPTIGIPQRGKWDINVMPGGHAPMDPQDAGAQLRNDVRTAYAKLTSPPATESREVTAADILAMRDELIRKIEDSCEEMLEKLK
jgi:hypothetical protein